MGIFGKKKEEKKTCCCSCGTVTEQPATAYTCCGQKVEGICCIKVLGAGCKSCHQQFEYAKEAVKNLGLDIEIEYITDLEKVMEYGVMSMPALVVNEKVVAMGKVLKPADIEKLFAKLGLI